MATFLITDSDEEINYALLSKYVIQLNINHPIDDLVNENDTIIIISKSNSFYPKFKNKKYWDKFSKSGLARHKIIFKVGYINSSGRFNIYDANLDDNGQVISKPGTYISNTDLLVRENRKMHPFIKKKNNISTDNFIVIDKSNLLLLL